MPNNKSHPPEISDRFFDPNPAQKSIAIDLYQQICNLPLICPHGHVDPRLFADPDYSFGTPVDLLIIPDHYVFRMLYSQGVPLESLGIRPSDGGAVEQNHRKIWQKFADHYYLFRGTPTGMWFNQELREVFGVEIKLNTKTAQDVYDQIAHRLEQPEFTPRSLYEQFNIEALTTTDSALDSLEHHQAIQASGWDGRIYPTFRPDTLINLNTPNWQGHIEALGQLSGITVHSYSAYIQAIERRRSFFKEVGAVATDHDAHTAYTIALSDEEAEKLFQQALRGELMRGEVERFRGHMLMEMARMSTEDGLVMQIHVGSYRNHNQPLHARFGSDMGSDIPVQMDFTRNLQPLLARYGNHPNFSLILFTLDEAAYARELAPLAGHYPALKLGPPWWFHDSLNGIRRYFDQVMETAGIYSTTGFNDDTRAFPSIPARHDLWRRASANWLAGLVVRHIVDMDDATEMAHALAYGLAKKAYKLQ